MLVHVVAYIATALVFLLLDFLWLTGMASGFYRERLGGLLLDQPNFAAAGAFYVIYVAGIVYFAVSPALQAGSWTTALVAGAMLGLVAYGTYDLSNLATLRNWSLTITIVDMIWGAALTAIAATAGYHAAARVSVS